MATSLKMEFAVSAKYCTEMSVWFTFKMYTSLSLIAIICNELMSPAKGTVEYSDPSRIFNSRATYSCDEGYTLTGNSQRICVGLNIWSGSEPTCTGITLSNPLYCITHFLFWYSC